jgi:crossover junction endodeoxyribonuclease RuvC
MSGDLVIGIDPGIDGAIAVLTVAGALIVIHDLPTLPDGPAGRRRANPALLVAVLAQTHAAHAFVELVHSRPTDGHAAAFAFGMTRGVLDGVLAALAIPVTTIASSSWKNWIGLPPGKDGAKDRSRAEAIRRWPGQAGLFARVRDNGRSDAALIGLAGLMRDRS